MYQSIPAGFVVGRCRNDEHVVAHLYKGTFGDPGEPMCARGWNRDNGFGYSIFRGESNATAGICKVCVRRALKGLDPVPARERKTKWL